MQKVIYIILLEQMLIICKLFEPDIYLKSIKLSRCCVQGI